VPGAYSCSVPWAALGRPRDFVEEGITTLPISIGVRIERIH
jgi:hypothetical protein